ncbi:hypothetical protein EDB92DRAFT_1952071 [Lactarius akahatsu]|uniref:Uncharacterized protein n=1 Tax=Lactarius akahatsu TaxID=416441 RepID=A0AAD4L8R2_9AGAM|nr:hypothetical protein EDB92DRAFT_1952071 [Lactarius akahatsu]
MFEIDWDTEDDRHRRRRKASTIHGWLCMWRGTLIGNERERQRGRREMKEARAVRAYYRQRAHETAGGGSGPFSLFRLGSPSNSKRNANNTAPAPAQRPPQRHRSHSSQHHHYHRGGNRTQQQPPQNRPAPVQRKSSRHAPQEPMRQHSSHSAKSRPSTSRRPSAARR